MRDKIMGEINAVTAERRKSYGCPFQSHKKIGRIWTAYLKNLGFIPEESKDLSPVDVAQLMVLFKQARETNAHSFDNGLDQTNYTLLAYDFQEVLNHKKEECTPLCEVTRDIAQHIIDTENKDYAGAERRRTPSNFIEPDED